MGISVPWLTLFHGTLLNSMHIFAGCFGSSLSFLFAGALARLFGLVFG